MIRIRYPTLGLMAIVLTGCAAAPAPITPQPSSAAAVSAPSRAAPSDLEYAWPEDLQAGTYTTSLIWDTPVVATFTVPDGWTSRDVEVIKDPVGRQGEVGGSRGRSVVFALADNVYADPCTATLLDPPIGGTVDDFATALAGLPGIDASTPEPVTFAGHQGKYLEFTIRPDGGCELEDFHLWTVRPQSMKLAEHRGPPFFTGERERNRLWILDVDGTRYIVGGLSAADATPEDLAELQAVLDSIRLES